MFLWNYLKAWHCQYQCLKVEKEIAKFQAWADTHAAKEMAHRIWG